MFVLDCCETGGVQVITPVVELITIPVGAETRLNVRRFAGISASNAVLVIVMVAPTRTVCGAGTVNTGALFTSLTTTVKLLLSVNGGVPLSATCTVNVFVLGPWASVGVQLTTPLALMAAPAGAWVN